MTTPLNPDAEAARQRRAAQRRTAQQLRAGTYQRGPAGTAYLRELFFIQEYGVSRQRWFSSIRPLAEELDDLGHDYALDPTFIKEAAQYENAAVRQQPDTTDYQTLNKPVGWIEQRMTEQINDVLLYRDGEPEYGQYHFYRRSFFPPPIEWWYYH